MKIVRKFLRSPSISHAFFPESQYIVILENVRYPCTGQFHKNVKICCCYVYFVCFFAEELGSKLDQYIATLSVPVFAIRSPERTGLIRARLKGIYFILINSIIEPVHKISNNVAF